MTLAQRVARTAYYSPDTDSLYGQTPQSECQLRTQLPNNKSRTRRVMRKHKQAGLKTRLSVCLQINGETAIRIIAADLSTNAKKTKQKKKVQGEL